MQIWTRCQKCQAVPNNLDRSRLIDRDKVVDEVESGAEADFAPSFCNRVRDRLVDRCGSTVVALGCNANRAIASFTGSKRWWPEQTAVRKSAASGCPGHESETSIVMHDAEGRCFLQSIHAPVCRARREDPVVANLQRLADRIVAERNLNSVFDIKRSSGHVNQSAGWVHIAPCASKFLVPSAHARVPLKIRRIKHASRNRRAPCYVAVRLVGPSPRLGKRTHPPAEVQA